MTNIMQPLTPLVLPVIPLGRRTECSPVLMEEVKLMGEDKNSLISERK